MQDGQVEGFTDLLRLERGGGDFFRHQAAQGASEAIGHDHLVLQHVLGNVQAAGEVAGIEAPDHDGGHHFVLGALAGFQHALHIGHVVGQQLAFEFGLALVRLHLFQAQAVLQQLVELMLVGGGTGHGLGRFGRCRFDGGSDPLEMAAAGVGHGRPLTTRFRCFQRARRIPDPRSRRHR
ncbi:hypothetical protein D3C81_1734710 [compost metagenome]